jgi:hypothetical protein
MLLWFSLEPLDTVLGKPVVSGKKDPVSKRLTAKETGPEITTKRRALFAYLL